MMRPVISQPSLAIAFSASSTFLGLNMPPNVRSFCAITLKALISLAIPVVFQGVFPGLRVTDWVLFENT